MDHLRAEPNVRAALQPTAEAGCSASRFNAARHGLTARSLVLPWEDEVEFERLLTELLEEHQPRGPTERHLVEQIAALLWRQHRVLLAEGATIRAGLNQQLDDGEDVARAALAHLGSGHPSREAGLDAGTAFHPGDAAAEAAELEQAESRIRKALAALRRQDGAGAHRRALELLEADIVAGWEQRLEDHEANGQEPCTPDGAGLARYLEHELLPWLGRRR
jgi:hypothetical protein